MARKHLPLTMTQLELQQSWWFLRHYSVTYSNATRLFPRSIRGQVAIIYAWVRLADELVDNPRQDQSAEQALAQFRDTFLTTWKTPHRNRHHTIHYNFVCLAKERGIQIKWCLAFLDSMEMDLRHTSYSQKQLNRYVFGSAEVIGLMMARVMNVPEYDEAAKALGKWMQLVNFIRDIGEDVRKRQRVYIPIETLQKHNLGPADMQPSMDNNRFALLLQDEISQVNELLPTAWEGVLALPYRYRLAVELSARLYLWTLESIERDPSLVWHTQLKPSRWIIIKTVAEMLWDHARRNGSRVGYRLQSFRG